MTSILRIRLSTMMLFQYFIWGSWYVTLGNYLLNTLHFSGEQVGHAYSTFAIAAMISPFFVGMIADKYFAVEKLLGGLHIIGAVLLFVISQITDFTSFYICMLLYALCYTPTMALSNSLSFHQMKDPGSEFPSIRVLGTIGWIVAGLTISYLGVEAKSTFFLLASGVSAALGIYSFSLPHVPPNKTTGKKTFVQILGLDAFSLLKKSDFAIMIISSFLISIPLMFYYLATNAFLNEEGIVNVAGKMTMGQMSEILFMLVMPFFFRRLGVKKMIMVGMLAWTSRYLLFAYGNSTDLVWMFYTGIILHGICYDFFFVTGQIFVDKRAPEHLRSSAQGLVTFATYGMGFYFGSIAAGKVVDLFLIGDGLHDWRSIWMVPALFAIGVFVFFTAFFKDKLAVKEN